MGIKKKKWIYYLAIGILLSASLVYLLFNNLFFIYTVRGESMHPTLSHGDRIIIRRLSEDGPLNRFDIVVFRGHRHSQGRLMIKRVIGLPGDRIELRRDRVFINGQELAQPFLDRTMNIIPSDPKDLKRTRIPEQSFYILGDNREDSRDSRHFGWIKRDRVIGRVIARYWPLKRIADQTR